MQSSPWTCRIIYAVSINIVGDKLDNQHHTLKYRGHSAKLTHECLLPHKRKLTFPISITHLAWKWGEMLLTGLVWKDKAWCTTRHRESMQGGEITDSESIWGWNWGTWCERYTTSHMGDYGGRIHKGEKHEWKRIASLNEEGVLRRNSLQKRDIRAIARYIDSP